MSTKTCTRCHTNQPLSRFGRHPDSKDGLQSWCNGCKADQQRERRAEQTTAERNAKMRAYKAGMRKDKCAVCGSAIEGHGICSRCAGAIAVLGGTESDLKRAAKAIKYLQGL